MATDARVLPEERTALGEGLPELSRAQLATLLGSVGDGVTVQDRDGRLVYANEAAARVLGQDSRELLGMPGPELATRFELMDEAGRPLPASELPGRYALKGVQRPWLTVRFRARGGGPERWSAVRATPIFGADGQVQLVVNLWHDITEQRHESDAARYLAEASALLAASSRDLPSTLAAIARLAVPHFADWCAVDVLAPDGTVRRVETAHVDPAKVRFVAEVAQRYPPRPDHTTGVHKVLRTGESDMMEEIPDAFLEKAAVDAEHLRLIRELGLRSYMVVPLAARGQVLGALSFVSAESGRRYVKRDLALAEDLGRRAGLAMENARLFMAAEAASAESERQARRMRFIANCSPPLLAASLDYEKTLASVARMAVPEFAEWCTVHVVEQGRARRVEVAHQDPAKVALGLDVERRYPARPGEESVTDRVLRTGRSELFPVITDELLAQAAHDAEHLRLLGALGLRSLMTVPLVARGRPLGVLTFVRGGAMSPFDAADLTTAEDLGQRAGLALDNARLHAELQSMNAQLDRRVRDRTAQLEEANRELESFSYSVSHDLRAPVRHIDGFAELLEKAAGEKLDAKALHYLHTIRDSARRAGQLVDDLLAFSRMGRAELRNSPLDLGALVADARRELEPELAGRAIEWDISPLPTVQGDPAMMKLVFQNLLSNAVKFTQRRDPARIQVGATWNDGEVIVFVKDNGAGFDMRYADKLFGVFQRLHGANEFPGTGIGLANVRRIVHRHGGRTWAEGEPERGATFYFSLPVPPDDVRTHPSTHP